MGEDPAREVVEMPPGEDHDRDALGLEAREGGGREPVPDLLAVRFRLCFLAVLRGIREEEDVGSESVDGSADSGRYVAAAGVGLPAAAGPLVLLELRFRE